MSTIYNSQLDAFELHHLVQELSSSSTPHPSTTSSPILEALQHALSGATGAALSNILIYPLDLIITRLQIQRQLHKHTTSSSDRSRNAEEYKSLSDAVTKIADKDGWQGLWAGCKGDTMKTVLDVGGFFLVYTWVRGRVLARRSRAAHLTAWEELSVGWVSGSMVRAVVMPWSVVVARAQTRGMGPSGSDRDQQKGESLRQIAEQIYREKGLQGFWAGYQAALVLTLNPSLTFALHAVLSRSLPRSLREKQGAVTTFLVSASSKAVASAVMYPFSLAKTRLMVGGRREREYEEDAEKEVEAKASGNKGLKKEIVRETLLSTLMGIVENEGIGGLYEGLGLEMCKGFLSHGITMVVKQAVQRFVVKLWYILSVLSRRYRRRISGERMKKRATETVEYYNLAMARAGEKIEHGVKETVEWTRQKANETAEFVGEYVEEGDTEGWREAYLGPLDLSRWLDERKK
ncbi:Peroxisomal adenine nucleotide transporter 1 [Cyphellophora attinorum]|uniref:Peroxisomal adenine nucleotide transporter 1 n=1 Tax=Cyphellophora attinorum TaxID=1664694 RepID=A0A0N1HQ87_9EURO|nr:Peroxisomal adenine nucleotide transporter 1 [Phialophora attinorum]KPI40072.1 Peroxisomal adenine nucleotide transporter 1 [Phialophora attinorum]